MPTDWQDMGARDPIVDREAFKAEKPGDTLTGTLASVRKVDTKFGAKIVIEFDNATTNTGISGSVSMWPTQGALDAFKAAGCEIRDELTVTLVELVDTDKGNPFKRFEITAAEAPTDKAGLFDS
jgi:hypothetical protein